MIETFAEFTEPLYIAFMEYEKAFYSVLTAAVQETLKDRGIDKPYKILLQAIYKGCTGRITLHKQLDTIPTRNAVRQGDAISPKLFTAWKVT